MKRSIDQVYRSYNRLRTMFVDNGTLIGKDPHYASSSSIDPIALGGCLGLPTITENSHPEKA